MVRWLAQAGLTVALVAAPLITRAAPPDARGGAATDATDAEVETLYHDASDLRRAGAVREAALRFEAIAAEHPSSRLAPRALASAAAIWQWDLDDLPRALALYDRVIADASARGADRPGVLPAVIQRLELERDARGPAAELALATKLLDGHANTELGPYLLMRAATICREDLADPPGALTRLDRLLALYPKSTRADEALMMEAELLRELHRPKEALDKYRAIIATQSSSFIVGEYNSSRLDDAYYELAETYRRDLRELASAEAAYRRLVSEVPDSRLVDDALHFAAELAEERGDAGQAAKDRADLARLRPASRWLRPASVTGSAR